MAIAVPASAATTRDEETLAYFRKLLRLASRNRSQFERACEHAHSVYRGDLAPRSGAASWRNQQHPGYAWQKVETLYANLLDEEPVGRVLPDDASGVDGAEKMERLLAKQRRDDKRNKKLARFIKQGLVFGISPAKLAWRYEERDYPTYRFEQNILGGTTKRRVTQRRPCWNQPTFTPFDPRDFYWDPAATTIEECSFVIYRFWTTIEHLRDWEQQGRYRNVADVAENQRTSELPVGSRGRFEEEHAGQIEAHEAWIRTVDGLRLVVVANQRVVLADVQTGDIDPVTSEPDTRIPDHGDLPFVCFVPTPDVGRLDGFSTAERIAAMQQARWKLLNQRLDGTEFVGNPMMIGLDDQTDKDKVVAPGARWNVAPDAVQAWHPPIEVLQPLMQAEQDLGQQMDDVTGVNQYVSGVGGQVDPKTATEFSGYQGAAQRRIVMMRTALYEELHRAGLMEISLNQQFIDTPMNLPSAGDSSVDIVQPYELAGAMTYDIEDAGQAVDKQKRRDEAQLLAQQLLAWAPIALQQGVRVSIRSVFELLGDAFDKKDWESWLEQAPAPPVMDPQQLAGVAPGSGGPAVPASPPVPPTPQVGAGLGGPRFRPVASAG